MENSARAIKEVQTTSSSPTFMAGSMYIYKHCFVIVEVGKKNIRAHCKLYAGNKT